MKTKITNKTNIRVGWLIYLFSYREIEEYTVTNIKVYETVIDITACIITEYGKRYRHVFVENRAGNDVLLDSGGEYERWFTTRTNAEKYNEDRKAYYRAFEIERSIKEIAKLFKQ